MASLPDVRAAFAPIAEPLATHRGAVIGLLATTALVLASLAGGARTSRAQLPPTLRSPGYGQLDPRAYLPVAVSNDIVQVVTATPYGPPSTKAPR